MNKQLPVIDSIIKLLPGTVLLGLFFLAFISLIQGSINAITYSQDSMWPHINLLLNGLNPYEIFLNKPDLYDSFGYSIFFGRGVHYPPSVLYLMSPLTLVSDPVNSKILLLIINLIASVIILIVFGKLFFKDNSKYELLVISALFIMGLPFRNSIGVGQNGLIAVAFLMLSILFLDKKFLSIIFFSFSLIKYTLTGPFILYLLFKRKFSTIFWVGFIHIIFNIIGSIILKVNFFDLMYLILETSNGLVRSGFIDILSISSNSIIRILLYSIVSGFLIYQLLSNRTNSIIGIIMLFSLLVVYHRTYDYFVVIFLYPIDSNKKILKVTFYLLLLNFFIFVRVYEWIGLELSIQRLISFLFLILYVSVLLIGERIDLEGLLTHQTRKLYGARTGHQ